MKVLLKYSLFPSTRRLTFDITYQHPDVIFMGDDDGEFFKFVASNGYEVISRSRMDIQKERIWLLGANHLEEQRSGSMVFSIDSKRDRAHHEFVKAIDEWAARNNGVALNQARQSLTDEEIEDIDQSMCGARECVIPFARAVEAALGLAKAA
jgi:hypothetical protein